MRRFPAAVNVVTTGDSTSRAGFTASAAMSLTAEPPQIGVAVNRSVSAFDALCKNAAFCVNTLSTHHHELARLFSGPIKGQERFQWGSWTTLSTGCPVLSDAVLALDCTVDRRVELSTHILLIGTVKAARLNSTAQPLLYFNGDFASLLAV